MREKAIKHNPGKKWIRSETSSPEAKKNWSGRGLKDKHNRKPKYGKVQ